MWSLTTLTTAAALLLSPLVEAVHTSRLTPPVLPLIVRNPYLSTWLADAREAPWERWPMFWTGQELGFSVLARVPDTEVVYPLLGRPHDSLDHRDQDYNVSFPAYHGSHYDASTTNLTYSIPIENSHSGSEDINITLSFLSPITPTSTFRQSIPAAYLTVHVSSSIDVDIYVDVNGQWVSGDRGSKITWTLRENIADLGKDGSQELKTWEVKREVEQHFTEYQDRAEWGTLHFSAPAGIGHEAGVSEHLRKRFAGTGKLQNKIDDGFRTIQDAEPVFAFAKSFKSDVTSSGQTKEQSITFTIAHVQDEVIQFAADRGLTLLRPFWKSYIPQTQDMLMFHYLDFEAAKSLADNYSIQLAADALKSGAEDYVDIVAASARQVMGATCFAGTPDDPLLFLKEISSDGNTQTIDVIYPAFPFFMYTNPRWLAYMLEPLIEHMLSGQYPNDYAMHDIGAHYPNATGHSDGNDEYMPVEECGNILIMGLALVNTILHGEHNTASSTWKPMTQFPLQKATSVVDKVFPLVVGQEKAMDFIDEAWVGGPLSVRQAQKWVTRSYKLWQQWTGYLVEFSLRPHNQLSTDDFAGWLALQTNLALKGIIGIKAMASLSQIAGNEDDAKRYENISKVYIEKWEEYGISRDKTHAKLAYDWFGSWTTTYNLYADALLCFHLDTGSQDAAITSDTSGVQTPLRDHKDGKSRFVPSHIYQIQSDWYWNVRQKYGLPLDSRHTYTKTDWEFFSMAVAAPKVRASILQSVAKWVNETNTDRPLTDLHDTENEGGYPGPNFFARPVVGGHFAFLSLERACDGHAMDGLKFLKDDITERQNLDVQAILHQELLDSLAVA